MKALDMITEQRRGFSVFASVRTVLLLVVLLGVSSNAWAQLTPADYGYSVIESRRDGDGRRLTLESETGDRIEVRNDADSPLTGEQLRILDVVATVALSLETADVSRLTVAFSGRRADILIVPTRFSHDGVNLLRYVPSGIQFRFDQVLEYDFRVRVDEYFIRFRGQYLDEIRFADRLVRAVRNPVDFLDSLSPELVAARLDELESEVLDLTEQMSQADNRTSELLDRIVALEERSRATEERSRATEESLAQATDARRTAQQEFESLREGVLGIGNQSFFGRLREIDSEVVGRIVAIRDANPDFSASDVRSALSDAGVSASRSEVSSVLAVYFGQFE